PLRVNGSLLASSEVRLGRPASCFRPSPVIPVRAISREASCFIPARCFRPASVTLCLRKKAHRRDEAEQLAPRCLGGRTGRVTLGAARLSAGRINRVCLPGWCLLHARRLIGWVDVTRSSRVDQAATSIFHFATSGPSCCPDIAAPGW